MKENFSINKKILNYCPNYYRIINAEFYEEDKMTERLIRIYQDYVFNIDINDNNDLKKLKEVDEVYFVYLNDHKFKEDLERFLLEVKVDRKVNLIEFIIDKVIELFENYQIYSTQKITIPRWI